MRKHLAFSRESKVRPRVSALAGWAIALTLPHLTGCAGNPYVLQSQNKTLQQQQLALQQRNQELQSRASTLDQDNQELESLLAQARQQGKLVEDQLAAVREQLSSASAQLGQLQTDKQLTEKQAEALLASTKRRGGATITANSSLARNLPALRLPGVELRADGDVVRIELPAAQLFQAGTANLMPTAGVMIDNVAAEIGRAYPEQTMGVEGHTDNDPSHGPQYNQQLSAARALAVYQYVTSRGKLPPAQLFTVGHGGNHPVVSNATPAGRQRNNRVELVVYPEQGNR